MSTTMFLLHGHYDDDMRRKKESVLLWLLFREYGLNFSHTLHDVSEVHGGTIRVQRGYYIAFED